MITVNMHEAKTRLSQLVAAAIEGEEVVLCRNGQPRVRLVPATPAAKRDLTPDPRLAVGLASGFDPTEPLAADEWPEDAR